MSYYYNAAGGCFEGNCEIRMGNGELKKVKEVKKGDQVLGFKNSIHKVKFVVKINCINKKQCLVKLGNGLLITRNFLRVINTKIF